MNEVHEDMTMVECIYLSTLDCFQESKELEESSIGEKCERNYLNGSYSYVYQFQQ